MLPTKVNFQKKKNPAYIKIVSTKMPQGVQKAKPNVRCKNWSVKFTIFTFSVIWAKEIKEQEINWEY